MCIEHAINGKHLLIVHGCIGERLWCPLCLGWTAKNRRVTWQRWPWNKMHQTEECRLLYLEVIQPMKIFAITFSYGRFNICFSAFFLKKFLNLGKDNFWVFACIHAVGQDLYIKMTLMAQVHTGDKVLGIISKTLTDFPGTPPFFFFFFFSFFFLQYSACRRNK